MKKTNSKRKINWSEYNEPLARYGEILFDEWFFTEMASGIKENE
jgi:hypothetical protein